MQACLAAAQTAEGLAQDADLEIKSAGRLKMSPPGSEMTRYWPSPWAATRRGSRLTGAQPARAAPSGLKRSPRVSRRLNRP